MTANPDRNLYEEAARETKVRRALMWIVSHEEMRDGEKLREFILHLAGEDSFMLSQAVRVSVEAGANLKSPMGEETVSELCSELHVYLKMMESH